MGDVVSGIGGMVDNTLGTNIFGQNSNVKGANAQGARTAEANAALTNAYNDQKGFLGQYNEAGLSALAGMQNPNFQKSFSMSDFQQDPGYQFRLDEGNKAITNAAAARGMGNSGAAMKELAKYGQNLASQEYQNAYNRFNQDQSNQFNRLSALAGIGQNAATNLSGAAGSYGSNISNNLTGLGNAQAAAHVAQGNQQSNFVGRVMDGAMSLFSDQNLKINIEEVSKSELQEMKTHLKAFAFNYKNDEHGKGDWVGVMAQDLEKSKLGRTLVFQNEKGEKEIDIRKVLSMFLATMAEA